jgi:protoheme IX farnesyltransferase
MKTYYRLTKPGIIRGNLISATAGFLLASKSDINFILLFYTLLGTSLVIASGCVFNNYLDIDIDKKMSRTKNRATVTGAVSVKNVIIFASILGLLGIGTLFLFTNVLTTILGLIGLFFYVVVYGYYKRNSVHGTLIGSISGSIPPVAGYTAVSGSLDVGAMLLFLVLATWQMPHFYAIAIYRIKDYKAASIPVLPLVKGIEATKKQMIIYMILFAISALMLWVQNYTGLVYLIIMTASSLWWIKIGITGYKTKDNDKWAKSVFKSSLLVLLIFSFMISIDSFVR